MNKWIKRICNLLIILGILGLSGCLTRPLAADITDLEGTTGYIGKEDIKWGTGQSTDTFTVTTYDHGSATLTKVPDPDAADESVIKGVWYVAAMAGDHGNAALTGSLAWVIATLAGDPATVLLPGNQTYQISTDLTVPATVCLVMHRGAIFSVDVAKTLTINGDVLAGAYQIFSGAGTITLGANIIEHDQWRDGAGDDILPSADNVIDLGSGSQRFKEIYSYDLNLSDDATIGGDLTVTDQITTARISGHPFPGLIVRPKFTWKDADEIYIDAGVYYHNGTTEQLLYWDSQITYQFTSLAVSDWSYLYFDNSAIVTADTNLIATGQLTDSITEPGAWSNTKHGRYNGEDLCFFAVLTGESGTILEFLHDGGDYVIHANSRIIRDIYDLDTTWVDVDCATSMPVFSAKAMVTTQLYVKTTDLTVSAFWRVNGQSGTTGHYLTGLQRIGTDQMITSGGSMIMTDSSQIFEVKTSRDGDDTLGISLIGWYFPNGL